MCIDFSFSLNASSQGFPVKQCQPQLRRIFHGQTLLAGYFWVRGLDTNSLSCIASLQTASPSSSAVSIVFKLSLFSHAKWAATPKDSAPTCWVTVPSLSLSWLWFMKALPFHIHSILPERRLFPFRLCASLSLDCISDCQHRLISLAGFGHSYHAQNVFIVISIFIFSMTLHSQRLPCPGPGWVDVCVATHIHGQKKYILLFDIML